MQTLFLARFNNARKFTNICFIWEALIEKNLVKTAGYYQIGPIRCPAPIFKARRQMIKGRGQICVIGKSVRDSKPGKVAPATGVKAG
ncbi:hypothetical protein ABEU86_22040 [Pseudomonas paraversuta]|uniref:hypothetical protein n=1 Tax=Pseudomonas paraversuta TaxID=2750624 RepID=UPI0012E3FA34